MHIAIITGTMPDIIKQTPIVHAAESHLHTVSLVHLLQHDFILFRRTALSIHLRDPDIILPAAFPFFNAIKSFTDLFKIITPDIVLAHGDTYTTMAAATAAHYIGIPVGHVEAGLRTQSREPWPEQTNTRIVDACSTLFFAPTEQCRTNLLNEGFRDSNILMCGNTLVDIVIKTMAQQRAKATTNQVYFSAHREENMRFPDRVFNIVQFANFLANIGYSVSWVLRGKTQDRINGHMVDSRIKFIDFLSYPESLQLLYNSVFACVDSGGLQEEAAILGTPCLTMRYITDRPETVEAGVNTLTTLEFSRMKEVYASFIHNNLAPKIATGLYGNGTAAEQILDFIENNNYIHWEDRRI